MADCLLGEIRVFSFPRAPRGWAPCDGRLLPVNQYNALFSLLGNKFGGDGKTNFALPDLRGKTMVNSGVSPTTHTSFPWATYGGAETVSLTTTQIPAHQHWMEARNANGGFLLNNAAPTEILASPAVKLAPGVSVNAYINSSTNIPTNPVQLNPQTLSNAGAGQAHENRVPFLTMNICIAITGIYPSRQ